jgi:hypothetical protein
MTRLNVTFLMLFALTTGCIFTQFGCAGGGNNTTSSSGGGGGGTGGNCTTQTPLNDLLTGCYEISAYQGGLYAGGTNLPPAHTDADAMTLVSQIQPLDTNGNPASSGLIIFAGMGMSMALAEFGGLMTAANNSGHQPANLILANESFSNNDADRWIVATPLVPPPACLTSAGISQCATNGPYDPTNSSQDGYVGNEFDYICGPMRLQVHGYSCNQVQIGWMDISNGRDHVDQHGCGTNLLTTWTGSTWNPLANYVSCIPLDSTNAANNTIAATDATNVEWEGGLFVRAAKSRMPNLKLMFFGSRIYGQYCNLGDSCADPGPYDYEKAFGIKALIAAQETQCPTSMTCTGPVDAIAGDLNYVNGTAPLILWAHAEPSQTFDGNVHSAYMWANGATPRQEDGLFWCDGQAAAPCNGEIDFGSDGLHLNDTTGTTKAGTILFNFFSQSKYTRPWFYQ